VSSQAFSEYLQQHMNRGVRTLTFITGGAFGFSDAVYDRVKERISLSSMTFPHQLVRLIFMEQLYRAFTILKGESYHHI
jgi:23S rRNA (pseudouridine1915-N3)-methyltransferase